MVTDTRETLPDLLRNIRACRICEDHLPLGPQPVVVAEKSAKILIIGQAPGTAVHESGVPWDDPSGDRLRDWMNLGKPAFYDPARIAIMPMGFCYPGRLPKGGDAPPRPECAPQWHDRLRAQLPEIELTLLVGSYAQNQYLHDGRAKNMTGTIRNWRDLDDDCLPTPHPSWRSGIWLKKNPWFEVEILPVLRERVAKLVG
tara:strand:- start:6048 stop:6647 length:600 start_codon:yes stop_codon:yes gene_type:complete